MGGREGIKAAEEFRSSVMLYDIGMPELGGYQTCRLVREQAWGQLVVLIAIMDYGQKKADKQRAKKAGFDGHLVKPVNVDAFTH